MSLSEQLERVDGAQKNTLKTILTKLGVSVGSQKIDQYPNLANGISTKLNPNNLVSASTASAYGLSSTATTNQVLAKARELITAVQNTANTAMSKGNLSKIGTADVSGMTVNNTGAITLSGNIRNYAEILLIFLDGAASSGTGSPYIEFTNLTPLLTYSGSYSSGAIPTIIMNARKRGGVGFAHLTVPYNNADFAAFYGENQFLEGDMLSRGDMAGLLSLPAGNTLEFSVLGAGTLSAGTFNVYGRKF